MPRRVPAQAWWVLLLALLAVAGCGGGDGAERSGATTAREDSAGHAAAAQLWVTHERGSHVAVEATVPAGVNAIQALEHHADVETRYGGRFVQAIDGVEGSFEGRHDWFYFLNGIEADLGGAEVTVRAGDVVWWDFRSWEGEMRQPVVVGAFPEPFLHGWDGKRRPAAVEAPPGLEAEAAALLALLGGADGEGDPNVLELRVEAEAEGATLDASRGPANDAPVRFTLAGSEAAVRAAARALAEDPKLVRFRYEARFDETGALVP